MPTLEDIYLFRHAVYRDVGYELQMPSERARLHASALEITEQIFAGELHLVAAELADHAHLAQLDAPAEVANALVEAEFRYLLIQIEQEQRRAQWESMVQTATRALECSVHDDAQLARLLTLKSEALQNLGRRQEAETVWFELVELGKRQQDNQLIVTGLCGAAHCQLNPGVHDKAADAFRQADAYVGDDPALRAKLMMDRAMLSNARGDFAEHEKQLLKALELSGTADPNFRRGLRGNIANMYGSTGRRDEAIAEYIALAEEFREAGNLRGLATARANLGRQHLLAGELATASEYLHSAIELATEIGIQRSVAFALASLAEVQSRLGLLEQARGTAERAREMANEQGLPLYHAAYTCTLAEIHLVLGHEQLAIELIENARAEFIEVHGAAFISEYCSPVRLRIAAWQAVSMEVSGRSTSRLKASPPNASWLPVLRELMRELEESRIERGASAGPHLVQALETGRNLVKELETAVADKRPALVFRGYLPSELRPEARQALVKRLHAHSPVEADMLQKMHPVLWQAMTATAD